MFEIVLLGISTHLIEYVEISFAFHSVGKPETFRADMSSYFHRLWHGFGRQIEFEYICLKLI